MAMVQANRYTHTRDGILPHTEAGQYDVAAFRDVGLIFAKKKGLPSMDDDTHRTGPKVI